MYVLHDLDSIDELHSLIYQVRRNYMPVCVRISLNKRNYHKEFNNITEIAKFNNFPITDIHKLNNQIKNKIRMRNSTTLINKQDKTNKYFKMTYYV